MWCCEWLCWEIKYGVVKGEINNESRALKVFILKWFWEVYTGLKCIDRVKEGWII